MAVRRARGRYRPIKPDDRRIRYPRVRFPGRENDWTPEFAYAIGLIATDGCLSGDGKSIVQSSKDRDLLEIFLRCIGRPAPILRDRNSVRVQIVDVAFYDWLRSIGLTPRKSLTLGPLRVPDRLFLDLARGLLDGDGSIHVSTVVPNRRRYPDHRYRRLRVEFLSASEAHIRWLQGRSQELLGLSGWVGVMRKPGRHPQFVLRYSKHASLTLLAELYRDPGAPRLERKWMLWSDFRDAPVT